MTKASGRKVVMLTGGNGALASGPGIINYGFDLTSVYNTFNSGGSAKRIMDEFGELHDPGDVRRCLWALQGPNAGILGRIFDKRFDRTGGGLSEHVVGNIILAAAQQTLGSFPAALREVGKALDIQGRVLPISMDRATAMGELSDSTVIRGEHLIDSRPTDDGRTLTRVWLEPDAFIYYETAAALAEADVVVLGPGDTFSSLVPMLCVQGLSDALADSEAKLVLVMNLMTKHAETRDFTPVDFAKAILSHRIGRDRFDAVIISTRSIPQPIEERYWQDDKARPVLFDQGIERKLAEHADRILCCDRLLSDEGLRNMIVRHDPRELGHRIARIAMENA